jgi:hypothetical protein
MRSVALLILAKILVTRCKSYYTQFLKYLFFDIAPTHHRIKLTNIRLNIAIID